MTEEIKSIRIDGVLMSEARAVEEGLIPLNKQCDDLSRPSPEGGRPEHTPSQQTRALVALMMGMRGTQMDCAHVIGISVKTLRKHYREELERAPAIMDQHVYTAFYQGIKKGKTDLIKLYLERMHADNGWKPDAQVNVATLPNITINFKYVKPGESLPAPVTIEHEPSK